MLSKRRRAPFFRTPLPLDVFGFLKLMVVFTQATHADGSRRGVYSKRHFWLVAIPLGHVLTTVVP